MTESLPAGRQAGAGAKKLLKSHRNGSKSFIMKYFIGITPPETIKRKIIDFQKNFPNNELVNMFEPHITIKSKNGLTENGQWLDKVKLVIERYPKFTVEFNGVGMFRDTVVILRLQPSEKLINLHKLLFQTIKPTEQDPTKEYFEDDRYEPHFTLGMNSWGMSKDELVAMKERAIKELSSLASFEVSFIRVYRQLDLDKPYEKFLDVPLYGI